MSETVSVPSWLLNTPQAGVDSGENKRPRDDLTCNEQSQLEHAVDGYCERLKFLKKWLDTKNVTGPAADAFRRLDGEMMQVCMHFCMHVFDGWMAMDVQVTRGRCEDEGGTGVMQGTPGRSRRERARCELSISSAKRGLRREAVQRHAGPREGPIVWGGASDG